MTKPNKTFERHDYTLDIFSTECGSTQVEITGDNETWGTWSSVVMCGHLYDSNDREVKCPEWLPDWVEKIVDDYEEQQT